jgi:hypothetical protein
MVQNRSSEQLLPPLVDFIPKDSVVFSDDWAAYRPLKSLGYRHFSVTHSAGEYSRRGEIDGNQVDIHINTLEGIHHAVRRKLLNKSRRNLERIKLLLGEEMYRRSGRPLFDPVKINQKI